MIVDNIIDLDILQTKIHPNPTKEFLNIELKKGLAASVSLKDFNGKTVLTKVINDEDQIDIESLPDGVYLLLIETELGSWIERVVKM